MKTPPLSDATASAGGSAAAPHGDVIIVDARTDHGSDDDDPEAEMVDALEKLFDDPAAAGKPGKSKSPRPSAAAVEEEEEEEHEDDIPDTTPAEEDDGDDIAPAAEDEEDPESEEDDDTKDEELRLPEKFKARLSKAKTQRDEARTERDAYKTRAEALAAQVEEFQAEPVLLHPSAAHPLSNTRNLQELDATAAHWQKLLEWAEENEDGGTLEGKDGAKELDRKQVRQLRKHAEAILEKHVPARRAYHEARTKHVAAVKKAYPFLLSANHKGAQYAADLVTGTALANRPDYELVAGDAYVGALIRRGLATAVRDSKTGEVKLMRVAKAGAAEPAAGQPGKKPLRSESGVMPAAPAGGKAARPGRVARAMADGDGEAALEALFD